MASDPSQGAKMFGQFRIALVRHGNAADRAGRESLGDFADLGPLQVIDFMADAIGGGGYQHHRVAPLGQHVAARRPGYVWSTQPKPRQETP